MIESSLVVFTYLYIYTENEYLLNTPEILFKSLLGIGYEAIKCKALELYAKM